MATKKQAPAKKASAKKRAPAKKASAKKRAPAKKASAKKRAPARKKAPARRVLDAPHKLHLHDDRFAPTDLIVRRDEWVHVTSERNDRNVPVHVPECFDLAGVQPLKKRGDVLKLKVLTDANLGKYPIKAPKKTGPNTDLKGDIEVISHD
ncbi:hypothetical protein JY651_04675 [Pyxidicoccus parkwayensis]|uniref:Uncharacterized protein n=1 Tax=Pyxidicoccus parkwayensis TaxID=2813578 RepID=A0ABX7P200_9BACT|nr:hypothetical protein [Pyxidicoccus parkwaysis]QSQ24265.1 hypothetical protein JY651_04675 [Pyxidicoccus parkwaysis]